jgi:hypothetical protein
MISKSETIVALRVAAESDPGRQKASRKSCAVFDRRYVTLHVFTARVNLKSSGYPGSIVAPESMQIAG